MTKEELEKKLQAIMSQYQNTVTIATKLAGIAEYLQSEIKALEKPKEEKK